MSLVCILKFSHVFMLTFTMTSQSFKLWVEIMFSSINCPNWGGPDNGGSSECYDEVSSSTCYNDTLSCVNILSVSACDHPTPGFIAGHGGCREWGIGCMATTPQVARGTWDYRELYEMRILRDHQGVILLNLTDSLHEFLFLENLRNLLLTKILILSHHP